MSATESRREIEEIVEDLSEKPREILRVFHAEDGVANTNDITTATGYDNATVRNHIQGKLGKHELVEKTGTADVDVAPIPPNEYTVTALGEDVLEEFRQREAQTEADISRVDELAETVERLDKENGKLRERLAEAEEQVEKHREAIIYIKEQTGIE